MNSAFRRALTTALLSIAASLLLAGALLPLLGARLDTVAIVMCVVTPFAIAFPVSLHTFRKKEELLVAHERLAEAHSQLAAAHRRLAEKAIRDDLTGTLNREAILDHLRTACDRPAASALLMIDADDFKKVNDTHGHMVGDEALKAIAGAMARALRPADKVGRIGGEEFAVLLADTDAEAAHRVAERIRREVEHVDLRLGADRRIALTVSTGGVCFAGPAEMAEVLREADRRLYLAKHGGRNQVVLTDGTDAQAA